MKRLPEIVGQKFAKLTVLRKIGVINKATKFECLCKCGNQKIVTGYHLIAGAVRSCGCKASVKGKPRNDLSGQRFGRLTVVGFSHMDGERSIWDCVCDCGTKKKAECSYLHRDGEKSCGCVSVENILEFQKLRYKHGGRSLPEYKTWCSMKQRTTNPNHTYFHNYGGRGIVICKRWLNSFADFYADMGPKPSPKHSIDRIDNDGPYCKENCQWATRVEQNRNTRRTCHGGSE